MIQRAWGKVFALVAVAILMAASHVGVTGYREDEAAVRVSWSARPERVEVCRRVSDEELAKLAQHMRRRVVCEGTTARYHLEVSRNGRVIDTATIRGGGLRHDRELYVARELATEPGRARLSVRFVRLDSSSVIESDERGERNEREDDERRRRRAEAIPALLALDTTVTIRVREVVLVTYDANARRLVLRTAP
jgi:hypothetical protein